MRTLGAVALPLLLFALACGGPAVTREVQTTWEIEHEAFVPAPEGPGDVGPLAAPGKPTVEASLAGGAPTEPLYAKGPGLQIGRDWARVGVSGGLAGGVLEIGGGFGMSPSSLADAITTDVHTDDLSRDLWALQTHARLGAPLGPEVRVLMGVEVDATVLTWHEEVDETVASSERDTTTTTTTYGTDTNTWYDTTEDTNHWDTTDQQLYPTVRPSVGVQWTRDGRFSVEGGLFAQNLAWVDGPQVVSWTCTEYDNGEEDCSDGAGEDGAHLSDQYAYGAWVGGGVPIGSLWLVARGHVLLSAPTTMLRYAPAGAMLAVRWTPPGSAPR